MSYTLETIFSAYYCRYVKIKLTSSAEFYGYIVGIRFPVSELTMLYYVKDKHVEKFIKNRNVRWIEMMPFEMITELTYLQPNHPELEEKLEFVMMTKDITYREEH